MLQQNHQDIFNSDLRIDSSAHNLEEQDEMNRFNFSSGNEATIHINRLMQNLNPEMRDNISLRVLDNSGRIL
jgi:hypothetical protein